MDALQRKAGYCWNYDRAAPIFNMIIDCEPICFKYGGAKWMIELWKGQYGIMTGAEIGVYKEPGTYFLKTATDYLATGDKLSAIKDLGRNIAVASVEGINRLTNPSSMDRLAGWYACANDVDFRKLALSFKLKRRGQMLFSRGLESHWWLTGFKWGEFTQDAADLTMEIEIKFLDMSDKQAMRNEFVVALTTMGYPLPRMVGNSVFFEFATPKTPQPYSRSMAVAAQLENKKLVAAYNALKASLGLKTNDPNGFEEAANDIFEMYYKKIWRH
jgi:hypothetical protein